MTSPSSYADIVVPPWLWGGGVAEFFRLAGIRTVAVDTATNVRRIETAEHHQGAAPTLLSVQHLAGPGVERSRFADLTLWARKTQSVEELRSTDFNAALLQRRERAERTHDLVDAFNLCRLETAVATVGELAENTEHWYEHIRSSPLEGEPDVRPFVDASVHVLLRDPQLVHRVKFLSVLLRIEHDRTLAGGDLSHLKDAAGQDRNVFPAATGLTEGTLLLDGYAAPLLGALSPSVWGVAAFRAFGIVIYGFGKPLSGTAGDPAELIQTFPLSGSKERHETPSLSSGAAHAAVDWWGDRLNRLFGILTTPGVFADRAGALDVVKQVQALATVEQVFRRVGSIQASWRDANARLVLLFSVLDTLQPLTGHSWLRHCEIEFAEKSLQAIRAHIPASAAEILLPAAERAVDALRAVQDGFYLLEDDEDVLTVETDTGVQVVNVAAAAAQYLQILRDANHGHGSNKAKKAAMTDSLLGQHDGYLPHDISLLGYLYLLELMVNLDRLPRLLNRSKLPPMQQSRENKGT